MTQQELKLKIEKRFENQLHTVYRRLILIGMLLVLGIGCLSWGNIYRHHVSIRQATAYAQGIRTAAYVTAQRCSLAGADFSDLSQPNGFAHGVGEEILSLAMVPGTLSLLQVDETGYIIESFLYVWDGYACHFINGKDGTTDSFIIYKIDQVANQNVRELGTASESEDS